MLILHIYSMLCNKYVIKYYYSYLKKYIFLIKYIIVLDVENKDLNNLYNKIVILSHCHM